MKIYTVKEAMCLFANKVANKYPNKILTTAEIKQMVSTQYGIAQSSVMPSDFCYNRINNGIKKDDPVLFERIGRGKYVCLGTQHRYRGEILHSDRHRNERVVGIFEDNKRKIK